MKHFALTLILSLAPLAALNAQSPAPVASTPAPDAVKRHPLKGVITGIMADKSSLLIKHEEIPGVMRAMTMMFKVDEATVKAAKEGQALTGMMSRQGNTWMLEDVKLFSVKKS